MRILVLATLALLTLSIVPTPAQPPAAKPEDTITQQIRRLEERATRAEERLAQLEKAFGLESPEVVPVGEVTVNLAEERPRYLRVKVAIRVSDVNHKQMSALVGRKKAELRDAAITFLVAQTVKDVSGSGGAKRVQDGLKEGFGKILGDGKENPVLEVLFEEYVIQ